MTDREAMQMAWEYLDRLVRGMRMGPDSEAAQVCASLREALEQPPCKTGAQCVGNKCQRCEALEQPQESTHSADCYQWHHECAKAEVERLRKEQPQQEPVAVHQFRSPHCSDWYDGIPDHHDGHGPYEVRTLYTTPQRRKNVTYVCPVCAASLERQE